MQTVVSGGIVFVPAIQCLDQIIADLTVSESVVIIAVFHRCAGLFSCYRIVFISVIDEVVVFFAVSSVVCFDLTLRIFDAVYRSVAGKALSQIHDQICVFGSTVNYGYSLDVVVIAVDLVPINKVHLRELVFTAGKEDHLILVNAQQTLLHSVYRTALVDVQSDIYLSCVVPRIV